jgi:hypothetical protein
VLLAATVIAAVWVTPTPYALGVDEPPPPPVVVPLSIDLEGNIQLDRSGGDPCQIAVPTLIKGTVKLRIDFIAGTVGGTIEGTGTGGQSLPQVCDGSDDANPEWWEGTTEFNGTIAGIADPETMTIDTEVAIDLTGEGWYGREGSQYLCAGSSVLTSTCPTAGVVSPQTAYLRGEILPAGQSSGLFEWYTNFCLSVTPESNSYGPEGCPKEGRWEAQTVGVVWPERTDPVVRGISYDPAEPTSNDAINLVADAYDPDGDDLTYLWRIDGIDHGSFGPAVTWAEPEPGDHTIEVVATDVYGGSDEYAISVYVREEAGDKDDDGVPDDEDRCPEEAGTGADGCPEFAVAVGCSPARPLADDPMSCAATVTGGHIDESFQYSWYLDGAHQATGDVPSWTWAKATEGGHDIAVDVLGEGRSGSASVSFEIGVDLTDEESAGFRIDSLGCNAGITSDDALSCTVTMTRLSEDVGVLDIHWSIDGQAAGTDATSGFASTWGIDKPAPGDHQISVTAVDPLTQFAQGSSTSVNVSPGKNADIPPWVQAGAAGATITALGAWLWLEWMQNQRAAAEAVVLDDLPLERNKDGQYWWPHGDDPRWVDYEEANALVREELAWDAYNEQERAAALLDHEAWSGAQWDRFVHDCRDRAAAEVAAAAADKHDRELRIQKWNRLEDLASKHGHNTALLFLEHELDRGHLPTWQELQAVRNSIVKTMNSQALIDAYYQKSDVRFFAEGCQNTLAWGTGKVATVFAGEGAGTVAEWLVRNPEVPIRVGLAVLTGGKSELLLIPLDAWNNMEAAADRKLAEQNMDLTNWEAVKECIRAGAWHVGGEMFGEVIQRGSALWRGAGAEIGEETAEAIARRTAQQSDDEFVRRVVQRIDDQRAAAATGRTAGAAVKEAGEEAAEGLARSPLRQVDLGDGRTVYRETDDWLRHFAKEDEVIPLKHWHETGVTVKDARSAAAICAEENVEVYARTTNMESMRHIRNGTALPKPLTIKSKTIKLEDIYLGAKPDDVGLVGYFKPNSIDEIVDGRLVSRPNLTGVPDELHDAVTKRFHERLDEFASLKADKGFQNLIDTKAVRIDGGKLIDTATGKPFAGDIDAVFVKDKATGKFLISGPRYDRVMNRWMTEVGGQHGAEINVVRDLTRNLTPGTVEYEKVLHKAQALQQKLQAAHDAGSEIVIKFDADGALRRGPRDINIMPGSDQLLSETVDVRPTGVTGIKSPAVSTTYTQLGPRLIQPSEPPR